MTKAHTQREHWFITTGDRQCCYSIWHCGFGAWYLLHNIIVDDKSEERARVTRDKNVSWQTDRRHLLNSIVPIIAHHIIMQRFPIVSLTSMVMRWCDARYHVIKKGMIYVVDDARQNFCMKISSKCYMPVCILSEACIELNILCIYCVFIRDEANTRIKRRQGIFDPLILLIMLACSYFFGWAYFKACRQSSGKERRGRHS